MKIKALFLFAVILFLKQGSVLGQKRSNFKISSPDKGIQVEIGVDASGNLGYQVSSGGKPVIKSSSLGLTINGENIGESVVVNTSKTAAKSETINWPIGENAVIDNTYNELVLSCTSGDLSFALDVRVFNGSVAFRYVLPEKKGTSYVITKENTEFNFSLPSKIYQYHHESVFTPVSTDSLTVSCDLPATVVNGQFFLSIGEADNRNYTKAELKKGSCENSLSVAFVQDRQVIFEDRFETPWRTVSVGKNATDLHQFSDLSLKLSPPSDTDLSKIVPGKLIRAQLSTQSGLDCIDLAKKLDFNYIMFDAGWYGPERAPSSDPRVVIPAIDLPKVIEYGKQNGIGVILYVNYIGLQNHIDELLPLYKQWGIAGIKFGFIDGFTQKGLTWLSEVIRKVNNAGLLLNIHDNYKPTGLSRTYPYLLTQEGIRGDENSPDAFHTTTLPFTRFLAGAADFTFCFPNSKNSFSKNIKVSKAQQLALTVVYFSPLQSIFWYGQPRDYTDFDEIEFFKYVPTVWDESKYLSGNIGKNISVARRKGDVWFIGNASGFADWKTSLNLDFLDKRRAYTATIYEDGSDNKIVKRSLAVKRGTKLNVAIRAKGGQAIMIVPVKK